MLPSTAATTIPTCGFREEAAVMSTFIRMQQALLVVASLGIAASPLSAQTGPDAPTTGWVTTTFTLFDYSKGFGDDLTQVLERYDYWRLGDNRRTGVQLDA